MENTMIDRLRQKAEAIIPYREVIPSPITPEKAQRIIHELQVHQIELEMQNEELRQAQLNLEESRSRYADLYDFAPVGYLTLDRSGIIQEANLTAATQLGVNRGRLINSPLQVYLDSQDRKRWLTHFNKVFSEPSRQTFEVRFKSKDRGNFDASLESLVIEDAGGEKKLRTTIIDISARKQAEAELKLYHGQLERLVEARTAELIRANEQLQGKIEERQQAEAALRESEQFLSDIFTSIKDGLIVLDPMMSILRFNPAMEQFPHSTPMVGRKCFEVYHNRNTPCDICPVRDTLLTGQPGQGLIEQCDDQGAQVFVEIFSYPLINRATGQLTGVIACARDITQQKKASAALIELERKLFQSQRMEAIGILAGGIAHDFNNILMAIMGYTEMASYDLEDVENVGECLQQVLLASHRAKDLVRQILTLSRRLESEKKLLIVQLIVQEALKLMRAIIPTTIEIRSLLLSNSTILADATQIHQIIMNLASNAFHAMETNGGILDISLTDEELEQPLAAIQGELQPGRYVKLQIKDTGVGIDPGFMPLIWDPYFTTKEVGKGTGLGLATVLGLVKTHNGEMLLESELGQSSTFTIYFPVVEETLDTVSTISQVGLPSGTGRILFIDDEPALAALGQTALSSQGFEVTAKISSREALELFKTQPEAFDLVVMDLTMPQLTGLDLAREMHAIRTDIPIILFTGYAERLISNKLHEIGIREVLIKPLQVSQLGESINKLLKNPA